MRGDKAYYIEFSCTTSGTYDQCGVSVPNKSACQYSSVNILGTVNGCKGSASETCDLNTSYEAFPSDERNYFSYKYVKEYLGAGRYVPYYNTPSHVAKAGSCEAVQEVGWSADVCIPTPPPRGIATSTKYLLLSESDAKTPDYGTTYTRNGKTAYGATDYLGELKKVAQYGDYQDFQIEAVNCESKLPGKEDGWVNIDGKYYWQDVGCYGSICNIAFYDPDRPYEARVGDPTNPTHTELLQIDPEWQEPSSNVGNMIKANLLCEATVSPYNTLTAFDDPDLGTKSRDLNTNRLGEWWRFTAKTKPDIVNEYVVNGNTYAHCCGDDPGEQRSWDCDANEDFDPVTCKCVKFGTKTLVTTGQAFRPDCRVRELYVYPEQNIYEGQVANIVAYIDNIGGSEAVADISISVSGVDALRTARTLIAGGETRIVYQTDPLAVGTYTVTATVTCAMDLNTQNDSATRSFNVLEIPVTMPSSEETTIQTQTATFSPIQTTIADILLSFLFPFR